MPNRLFYGWIIVCVTFVTQFVSIGFVFYSIGVFFPPLVLEFGGSRTGVATGVMLMNVVTAAFAPFLGFILDRGYIRRVMLTGAIWMTTGFLILHFITALWQFYVVLCCFLGLGVAMLGPVPSSTLVSNWFLRRRGTALGVATMGISLGGVVMAPLGTLLITQYGWRNTAYIYAATILILVVPIVWYLVVNRPEDVGLRPDGRGGTVFKRTRQRPTTYDSPNWNLRDSLSDQKFWIIASVIGLNFCANGAVLTQIVQHGIDLGFTQQKASVVLSLIAILGVAGKILFGYICDHVDKRAAFWLAMLLQALGSLSFVFVTTYPHLLLTGAVFGLGMGGIVPLWGSLIGASFGRRVFGRIMAHMSPVMLPIQSIGIPLAAFIADRTGSYALAFEIFVGVYLAAMVVLAFLRLPADEPDGEVHHAMPAGHVHESEPIDVV